MNPIFLNMHVQESLRELVHTTINSSSAAFDGMIERFLSEPSKFMQGPWVSVDMPFSQIDLDGNGDWSEPFPEVPLGFPPYLHQSKAFERLGGAAPRSSIIATGTGSGKTEGYLWPILEHCRRNVDRPGIKAIIVYPMNALATDQARRIAAALTKIPSLAGVRAGLYADSKPTRPVADVTEESVITDRDAMWDNPPDILLTNYKMLDYLLMRGRDRRLWNANDQGTLRFLVVDEMHTFDGARGADIALLIRRLKSRLGTPDGHLVCAGSSATLGAGDNETDELRRYAETIFGEPFDDDAVITETRMKAHEVFLDPEHLDLPAPANVRSALAEAGEMDQPAAAQRLAACLFPDPDDPDFAALYSVDPSDASWRIALGKLLLEHVLFQRALKIIAEHEGPMSLDQVAASLSRLKALRNWEVADCRAMAEFAVALVSWARSGTEEQPRPLFNVRLQIWVREMTRMVASLPALEKDGQRSGIELHHGIDLDSGRLKQVLPVVNCNRCGATAHVGRLNPTTASVWAPLEQIYEEFFDNQDSNRIRLLYHDSIDRKAVGAGGGKVIVKGLLNANTVYFTQSDHESLEPGPEAPVWMYDPTDKKGKIDRTCPVCGHAAGLLLFGLRAVTLTSGVTRTLYTSRHNEEDPGAKPRFLMFSDSVQDATHSAAIAETRNSFSVFQKSLFDKISTAETLRLSLHEIIEEVPAHFLEEFGPDGFVARFISKSQKWRCRYRDMVEKRISIDDDRFLNDMKIRLGWEYFVDLSYRSHFSHALEANGVAVADVRAEDLRGSAEALGRRLRNQFPKEGRIPEETLHAFLLGVTQRMRRQGSVGHRYIEGAIATGTDAHPLSWFGAARQMGLRKTGTLPIPNPRRGLAPSPVLLHGSAAGFDTVLKGGVLNWYRDWLFRSLGSDHLVIGSDQTAVYDLVMKCLAAEGIVRRVDGKDKAGGAGAPLRQAWLLDPKRITAAINPVCLVCSECGKREVALAANADQAIGSLCTRIGCEGRLTETEALPRIALRRSLESDRNHRVVAEEHTGLLDMETRHRVETGFIDIDKAWAPNLISATPTLEMGIDIGDLSTLLLCSVPPEEANYVQRMGRSGRRDGNALNMVIANARPHDLQFWEDPSPMLAGQVRPPGVFLAAEEVLLRQVTAFTLDSYVAEAHDEDGDYGKVKEVLRRREKPPFKGFPSEWLEMVSKHGAELANAFLSALPQEVQEREDLANRVRDYLMGTGEKSIGWGVGRAFDEAKDERARLVQKRKEVGKELEKLRKRRAHMTPGEFESREAELERDRKELNRLIRTGIDDVPVIKFLTDKGILPNYAFPEEGVKLTSILSRGSDAPRDEDGLLYFEYVRPASSALSDFAPGQVFYANGRQVRIDRLEIGDGDMTGWNFCQSCSHAAQSVESADGENCPRCGDAMWSDRGSRHEVVRLKSVVSTGSEEGAVIRDGDERIQRRFDQALKPFYGLDEIDSSWFTTDDEGIAAPFGFEFIPGCKFRGFNYGARTSAPIGPRIAGEKRPAKPFRICRHCGSLQKPGDEDGKGTHPPNCPVDRDMGAARADWERDVFLMREFSTEAIRMVIPVVGEASHDDLKSFVAGVNLGMRRRFKGRVDHVRSTVVEERLDGMATVRSLYLYDSVPGGSGYLRQIGKHPEDMREVISLAAAALRDCPCGQEPERKGCFRCVKPYAMQFGPGEPDRERALGLMEAILLRWENLECAEAGIDDSIRGALVESELEQRFLQALSKVYGLDAITPQALPGGQTGHVLRVGRKKSRRKDEAQRESALLWTIERQVQIDARYPGLPRRRVDFLLTPAGRGDSRPIVIEMDGLEHHAETVEKDLLDRIEMIRSGKVRVWTLGWKDLDADPAAIQNPLADGSLDTHQIGRLGKALAHPDFARFEDVIGKIRRDTSFEALRRVLEGEMDADADEDEEGSDVEGAQADVSLVRASRSILIRSLVGMNEELGDLAGIAEVSDEGRGFLESQDFADHAGAGVLDLYMACGRMPPSDWPSEDRDLRVLLRARLPEPGDSAMATPAHEEALRSMWRVVNLLQDLRGFHVEVDGLDTLLPPDMSGPSPGVRGAAAADAWKDARELCDESFHPLIEALAAQGVSGPDMIGDDLVVDGRVVGMIEFGWSGLRAAFTATDYEVADWTLIRFDPEVDSPVDAVAKVLKALKEEQP